MSEQKKAKSNFLIFCEEKRAEIKAAHPEMKSTQVIQECSKQWKALSDDQKDVYTKKYQELKAAIPVAPKPEKPKSNKPKSAYITFCTSVRESVKAANPGIGPKDLMRKIAEEWGKLADDKKASYSPQQSAEAVPEPAIATPAIAVAAVTPTVDEPARVEKKPRVRRVKKSEPVISE